VYPKVVRDGPALVPWAPNRYKIADLMEALRAVSFLPDTIEMPAWLGGHDHLPAAEFVACANGLLHVPTRTLLAHDLAYFNRVAVPFSYQADPPQPTRWLAFLDELWHDDADAIATLAEFMGYVISGRRDLHKILLLIGPTRAGKGVIARVLKALVGRGNYAGPTLASLGTNFGLSPLIDKPLAIVSDARLGGGANVPQVVERLLSISGEDMLTVDVKYKEPWTGTLPTRFVVISNELPRFGDASGAIAHRFVILTLHESWLGRENPALTDELLTELPGILGWALDGLQCLHGNGRFTEPSSSRDAVVTLSDLVSPTSAFVRERCQIDPASEVPCAELYGAWRSWAEDNGHRVGSSSTFGRDLRAVLPSVRSIRPRADDRQRLYRGLRLSTGHFDAVHGPAWTRLPSGPAVQDGPAGQPFRSAGDGLPVTSEMPAAEPSATAEMDSWIATPRLSRASLADDWGTIE
jgi:putative DNA primase/helicase